MNLKTIASMLKGGKLPLLLRFKGLFNNFYKVSFLASMINTTFMEQFTKGLVTIEDLAKKFPQTSTTQNAVEAWLNLGVQLGVIKKTDAGFSLCGFMAKTLAKHDNGAIRALVREVADLHHLYIMQTPAKLEQGIEWKPSDQHAEYGDLIARSSQTLEPFLFETIDRIFPKSDDIRLLEVGCGNAGYIIYAARRHSKLNAVGLELNEHVAENARTNIQARNLQNRVDILVEDIRDFQTDEQFDVLTLYNNIYYFPVQNRIDLLRHAKKLLKPNGRILLTTGCQNGGIEFELVNLIHASTNGWGRLPDKDEMLNQMTAAGFERNTATNLLPGNKYYAFVGHHP